MVRIYKPGYVPIPVWWTRCLNTCRECGCQYFLEAGDVVIDEGKIPNRVARSECPTCGNFVATAEIESIFLKPDVVVDDRLKWVDAS